MNLQKLKKSLKGILGAYVFYAIMALLTYLTYEFMLHDLFKVDVTFINILGIYHILLILSIIIKVTIVNDK
jgi:hypothetical protein